MKLLQDQARTITGNIKASSYQKLIKPVFQQKWQRSILDIQEPLVNTQTVPVNEAEAEILRQARQTRKIINELAKNIRSSES